MLQGVIYKHREREKQNKRPWKTKARERKWKEIILGTNSVAKML